MNHERTKFIILCAARTGSTMLRHLLDSHPEICCYGEIMADQVTPDRWNSAARGKHSRLMDLYRNGPRQFLEQFGLYPPQAKAVGFKIKYDELVLADHAWLLQWLRDHREVRVIHLRRENRLKRFISYFTATRGHGILSMGSASERPAIVKVRLSVEECLDDFARIKARERLFGEYFKDHATLETTYEAVVNDRGNIREGIEEFLRVAPAVLTTPTLKINPENVREVLENYDALAAALRDTPYSGYFER